MNPSLFWLWMMTSRFRRLSKTLSVVAVSHQKVASSGEEAIGLLNSNQYRVLIIDVAFGRDQVKGWAVARR
jgi:hypothetical protein